MKIKKIINFYFFFKKSILKLLDEKSNFLFDFLLLLFCFFVGFIYILGGGCSLFPFVIKTKLYVLLGPLSKIALNFFFPYFCLVTSVSGIILMFFRFSTQFMETYRFFEELKKTAKEKTAKEKTAEEKTAEEKIAMFLIYFRFFLLFIVISLFFTVLSFEMYIVIKYKFRPLLESIWLITGMIDQETFQWHLKNVEGYDLVYQRYKCHSLSTDMFASLYEKNFYTKNTVSYKRAQFAYEVAFRRR